MRAGHHFTALMSATTMATALSGPAAAAWTKTYVVEWNEPAMYYGAKSGVIDPGTDCPKGTNPEIDWIKVLMGCGLHRGRSAVVAQSGESDTQSDSRPKSNGVSRQRSRKRLHESNLDA